MTGFWYSHHHRQQRCFFCCYTHIYPTFILFSRSLLLFADPTKLFSDSTYTKKNINRNTQMVINQVLTFKWFFKRFFFLLLDSSMMINRVKIFKKRLTLLLYVCGYNWNHDIIGWWCQRRGEECSVNNLMNGFFYGIHTDGWELGKLETFVG